MALCSIRGGIYNDARAIIRHFASTQLRWSENIAHIHAQGGFISVLPAS